MPRRRKNASSEGEPSLEAHDNAAFRTFLDSQKRLASAIQGLTKEVRTLNKSVKKLEKSVATMDENNALICEAMDDLTERLNFARMASSVVGSLLPTRRRGR